jgi:transcriptional regulator with XRE-family HTH domain
MSMRQAAQEAGISPTHWRQIETGIRRFRGQDWPETGAAQTVAKMALVVGATPRDLAQAGRDDAAGELEALIAAVESDPRLTRRQKRLLAERMRRDASDE